MKQNKLSKSELKSIFDKIYKTLSFKKLYNLSIVEVKVKNPNLSDVIQIMNKGFAILNKRLDTVDKRLDTVDKRLDVVDKRLDVIDKNFASIATIPEIGSKLKDVQ